MIMEVVKAMVHDQDLEMHLWPEAARTVVYVKKKSHIVLRNMSPEDIFTYENLEVSHLNIFGFLYTYMFPRKRDQN